MTHSVAKKKKPNKQTNTLGWIKTKTSLDYAILLCESVSSGLGDTAVECEPPWPEQKGTRSLFILVSPVHDKLVS